MAKSTGSDIPNWHLGGAFRSVSRCASNGKITASSDTVAMATHRRAVSTSTSRAFEKVRWLVSLTETNSGHVKPFGACLLILANSSSSTTKWIFNGQPASCRCFSEHQTYIRNTKDRSAWRAKEIKRTSMKRLNVMFKGWLPLWSGFDLWLYLCNSW